MYAAQQTHISYCDHWGLLQVDRLSDKPKVKLLWTGKNVLHIHKYITHADAHAYARAKIKSLLLARNTQNRINHYFLVLLHRTISDMVIQYVLRFLRPKWRFLCLIGGLGAAKFLPAFDQRPYKTLCCSVRTLIYNSRKFAKLVFAR